MNETWYIKFDLFLFDTETRLDWIQITSTWKRTWMQFEFTGGMFLCQETTFMNTNQKSNVKIDWCEWQIRFSECSHSHHITRMSEANECNWTNIKFSSLFICQSNLIFCFIPSYYAGAPAYMRVIISFLMFCLLTQTKTNIRNKTTSELVVVVCSY